MNKYEKAKEWFDSQKDRIDHVEFPEEHKEIYQELLNRAVPMKPKQPIPISNKNIWVCPECDMVVASPFMVGIKRFCSRCGQKIDWSTDE